MTLKKLFPGHFKLTREEYQYIWDNCLFVIDTNVLINLYRYSDSARNELLKIFGKIDGRLWMPYRVAEEYLSNRLSEISKQSKEYDATEKEIDKLKRSLENSRKHPFVSDRTLKKANKLFDEIAKELKENKELHESRFQNDDIQDRISSLFSGNIGSGFSENELVKLISEGEKRYKEKIPPGYKDQVKDGSSDSFRSKCRVYGDLIVWKEIIGMAKDQKRPVIFVTDDQKEDWWREVEGKTIGPRPELIEEFKAETGQDFLMYVASSFIERASKKFDEPVTEKVVEELKDIRNSHRYSGSFYSKSLWETIGLDERKTKIEDKSSINDEFNVKERLKEYILKIEEYQEEKKWIGSKIVHLNEKDFSLENVSRIHFYQERLDILDNRIADITTKINLFKTLHEVYDDPSAD
ncbi:PIN domain-containing protein [Saccharospirillum sp.]|uniref:PIN-like domain-containing protein n=1 Tax=Saccharospirillum sp. TaxID=2033801 RepID=UPI0034A0988C